MLTDEASRTSEPITTSRRLARARSIGWLGQTVASICWISSVFAYGLSAAGDWLQLAAASSWLAANVAALYAADD